MRQCLVRECRRRDHRRVTIHLDVLTRNAALDARETSIGVLPTLLLMTLPEPASTIAADLGVIVASIPLPSDWMAAASGGTKIKQGLWQSGVIAAGLIEHYVILDSSAVRRVVGSVTQTGVGPAGDMTVDNPNAAIGQVVTVITYVWTEGNT